MHLPHPLSLSSGICGACPSTSLQVSLLVQAHKLGGTSDAACGRRLDVLEELFSRQCVRDAALVPDRNGQTFLFYMAEWGGFSHSRYVEFDSIVEAAQELGVDINHQVGGSG